MKSHRVVFSATLIALAWVATAWFAIAPCSRSFADDLAPNLLIIQTDEHNFRTLGCYRDTLQPELAFAWGREGVVATPAIDRIADQGAICTSFYATSPVCTPSRASFFTGYYPQNTNSWQNDRPMDARMKTFANLLGDLGYATGYAGKWHLDGTGKPQWAPERKFGFEDNRFMFNRGHWKKFELTGDGPRVAARDKSGKPSYGLDGADETTFSTDWLTDRAIDFIRKNADRPFCFHLSLPDPHGPNTVRAPYDTMFADTPIRPPMTLGKSSNNPKWALAGGKNSVGKFRPELMSAYFGMVKCIDDNVQEIWTVLDDLKLTRRTMIVFTSDHGDLCFEHGRLNKGNPYEGSAKIPMLIHAPWKIKAGTIVHQALGTVDFLPTAMTLLGHDTPDDVQGRDAAELMTGENANQWEDITFLRAGGKSPGWITAVTDRYKLVVSGADIPWLFDLELDPHELINQMETDAGQRVASRLAAKMLVYGKKFNDPHVAAPKIQSQLVQLAGQLE